MKDYELPKPPEGLKWRSTPYGVGETAVYLWPDPGRWDELFDNAMGKYFVVREGDRPGLVWDKADDLILRVKQGRPKAPDMSEAVRRANG